MKQEQVARKLGITKQRYSELENHPRLQPNRIEEILKVLGYTADTAAKFLSALPPPPPRKFLNNYYTLFNNF
jgi:transcriptional regulator with XRE-family HTH domain